MQNLLSKDVLYAPLKVRHGVGVWEGGEGRGEGKQREEG